MSIITDASKEGWGGHLGDWVISSYWSKAWAMRHINWLELQAVWLNRKHFVPQLQGTALDVLSDNSTTVAYINKEGGTQFQSLCRLALEASAWCRQHKIFVASHLSKHRNVLEDSLSRGKHCHPTECWPTPQLLVFFWICPSLSPCGVNELTQIYDYVHPMTTFVLRVLRKLRLQLRA